MHVVVDTNVFVSALFFGGTPRKVYDLIETGDITPCFTDDKRCQVPFILALGPRRPRIANLA